MRVCVIIVTVAVGILFSCGDNQRKAERMAKRYCSSCHEFTSPHLLDKETWEKIVLPEMAFRMGLPTDLMNLQVSNEDLAVVISTIPAQPMVSEEDYKQIVNYFLTNAPDSLEPTKADSPQLLTQFKAKRISLFNELPQFSMLMMDSPARIIAGSRDSRLYIVRPDFTIANTIALDSPPSCIERNGDNLTVLEMGIMDPNDQEKGKLVEMNIHGEERKVLVDSLQRPVFFERADFNNDGWEDYVICAFGNYSGKLLIMDGMDNVFINRHVLDTSPGARKVVVGDFNHDGRLDIIALMTQGDERLVLHSNEGGFHFRAKTLLRFPAVYGSSYFEIHDFNKDGFFDILYANGDNSDYSPILKPYHGVRIFMNDGKQNFSETWFYPMNGASWAIGRDYDQDGDIDIAAISFFPDFAKTPEKSFIYFKCENGEYIPYTTPESQYGRWIVMDDNDLDRDGDIDLLLGALDFQPGQLKDFDRWREKPTSFLFLENKNEQ